ncbi:hypothetical protein [Pseudomonas mucidolens]|uniref:hypothetical protein n=1 Tax=Pseudomonas mucidolens TaxID=46679 RepID=UPI0012FDAAEE|nr:hypothetical protein [Pseudomonas mucidolens]
MKNADDRKIIGVFVCVGVGLLAMALGQLPHLCLIQRHREQACSRLGFLRG